MKHSSPVIESLRQTVNEHYGEEIITVGKYAEIEKVPTGIFSLDLELGGGVARGRAIILVGQESTCKSTVMYTMAGRFQRICGTCMKGQITEVPDGKMITIDPENERTSKRFYRDASRRNLYSPGEDMEDTDPFRAQPYHLECSVCAEPQYSAVLVVDGEHNYTRSWARRFGLVHNFVVLARPSYSEQVGDLMREVMDTGRVSFLGVDSLDAQGPKVEDESSIEDQQMGIQARVWNKIVRAIHSKLNKQFTYEYTDKATKKKVDETRFSEPGVCIVQQYREKIGIAYGSPFVMGGGKGKNFLASVIVEQSKGERITASEKDKTVLGTYFNFRLTKSKVSRPFTTGKFYFSHEDRRIHNDRSVLDYAVNFDVVEKSGSWFSYKETRLGQGEEKTLAYLAEHPAMYKAIRKEIISAHRKLAE